MKVSHYRGYVTIPGYITLCLIGFVIFEISKMGKENLIENGIDIVSILSAVFIYGLLGAVIVFLIMQAVIFTWYKIDKEGITYRNANLKRHIEWENIDTILLDEVCFPSAPRTLFICIVEKDVKAKKAYMNIFVRKIPQGMYIIGYRKRLLDEIKKYYKGEIKYQSLYLEPTGKRKPIEAYKVNDWRVN